VPEFYDRKTPGTVSSNKNADIGKFSVLNVSFGIYSILLMVFYTAVVYRVKSVTYVKSSQASFIASSWVADHTKNTWYELGLPLAWPCLTMVAQ
jgi:hypothetical protein